MKKSVLVGLLVGLITCTTSQAEAKGSDKLNVMTFNIRYDNPDDSLNNWKYRKERVANAIRFYDADILGTQEVLHNQIEEMKQRLPEYGMVGVGREDGKTKGEYSALWYKKDRFKLIDSGNFWLSQTPEKAGSMGWDGACERIASWAKLKDSTSGQTYFVLNTHFDHVGKIARKESVTLILNRIAQLSNGIPVIVTGDFNARPESDVYKDLTSAQNNKHLTDSRSIAPLIYGPAWSFHAFGKVPYEKRGLIDFIFVRNGLKVLKYGVLAETENEGYLSDHAPIIITIQRDKK